MKKILLITALLCIVATTKAQYIGSQYLDLGIGYITDQNQIEGKIGMGKVFKAFKIGGSLSYRNLDQDLVRANTVTVSPDFAYYIVKGSRFSLLGVVAGSIGFQKASEKSDLVRLERKSAFVYGYELGIRPELLVSPKCALFAQYKFEMLFNSIQRNNNHVGLGIVIYL